MSGVSVNNLFATCDGWGAAEWFERLVMAIRAQDQAVRDKDDVRFEMYRNIAASSAMRLVRDYDQDVRRAISTKPTGGE